MVTRYWVGGAANWDVAAGSKWATTSGGTGGASAPTLADTAVFDGDSGTGEVFCTDGSAVCAYLRVEGSNSGLSLKGTVNVHAGVDATGTITCSSLQVSFENDGYIDSERALASLYVNGRRVELWSSTTINSVWFDSGGMLEITSGRTLICNVAIGPSSTPVAYIRASASPYRATINNTGGTYGLRYLDVQDIAFTGNQVYRGTGFVDSGNNTGLLDLGTPGGLFMSDF